MADGSVLNEAVDWFSKRMITKLQYKKNISKPYWRDIHHILLLGMLKDEVKELMKAVNQVKNREDIILECCDVANFAMMIADKVRGEENGDI